LDSKGSLGSLGSANCWIYGNVKKGASDHEKKRKLRDLVGKA
jgi:hypothetical protein